MEAYLAPKSPVQVNKIASSCEICSGSHDTQYFMENLEQAFVDYASSQTDNNPSCKSHPNLRWRQPQNSQNKFSNPPNRFQPSGSFPNRPFNNNPQNFNNQPNLEGLVSNFITSQDARLSMFEDDLKQQKSEMTNKIHTFLKATNDRMTGALPSDTVKNLKLNVNSTSSVLSTCSYPMEDPQSLFHPLNLINAIKTCSKQTNDFQKDQSKVKTLTANEIGTPKLKEPEQTLEDEFKDLHLNLPVLEVLAHALTYNAILDKYVESLELDKSKSTFIQGEMPEKIKDPRLLTLPRRLGDSKPFNTLADLRSCVNLIPLYLSKKLKIGLLEETNHVFGLADGTKSYPDGIVKNVELHIGSSKLLEDFYVIDMEKEPTTPYLCSTLCNAKKDFIDYHLPGERKIARDSELNPSKDVLVIFDEEKPGSS
ncbi:DNA-directed DNA polymerase [Tanacetum coccineum]